MRILILGGGVFLGAAVLGAARRRRHAVTVFNRGLARSAWPDGVEALVGDRHGGLAALADRRWDAVVDTSGYVPADLRESTGALAAACDAYLFVSSISAYASLARAPVREGDPLAAAGDLAEDDRDLAHYGPQKAASEAVVRRAFGARALIVRPGLIVGPGDASGRFSYWPWRTARGGEMLVPAAPADAPLQVIDVCDLARFIVGVLERRDDGHRGGVAGVCNATGPAVGSALAWPALLAACAAEVRARGLTPATPVAVGEAHLAAAGVAPWSELPLWLPSDDADHAGFARVDTTRAEAAGLTTRPLAETVGAVLDEGLPAPGDRRLQGRLAAGREAELIASWRSAS